MTYPFKRVSDASEFNAVRQSHDASDLIDLDHLFAIARRQWRVVAVSVAAAVTLGCVYLFTAVPTYTASAGILIDTSNQKIVDEMSAISSLLGDDASVLSQVELLKSEKIALAVSDRLDLKHNALFVAQQKGMLQGLISLIKSALNVSGARDAEDALDDAAVQQGIVGKLTRNLDVNRVGKTFLLQLNYSSTSPGLAAQITQAYAEAYLTDQLDSKYEATRRASEWLQKRIAELRQKSLDTDLAVQKFKADKGLISTDGELVSDQQLSQINSQLILAQSDMANAEAKYNRLKSVIDTGDMEAAVTESLASNVINDLRTKYLEASRKETDISGRLGANHVQAVRLRGEMAEYRRLMFEELGRIAQSYQNNYEVALEREKGLQNQLTRATSVSASANDAQVQLRELERESDTYKKLYETFLQRYQEAVQQQSFPVTEARIISYPSKPTSASSPKTSLVLAISGLMGLMVGAGWAAIREFRDRFFRTADQIRELLDLEPIGTVPYSKAVEPIRRPKTTDQPLHSRVIFKENSLASYVIAHPLSSFAETMRSAKIAVDMFVPQKRPKMIGVVSVLPGEGKSTVSINFAELLASQGSRVLLIDADLRNPGATRQLGAHAETGILEALEKNGSSVRESLMINPATKLAFLPAVIKRRIPYSSELLASDAMDRIVRDLSDAFDYIIFDLPPLAPVVDARAMSSKLDGYIFVIEWGRTARNIVQRTLVSNSAVAQKCIGVILNKVDTEKMKFYQSYGSSEFYYSRYSSYYRD